MELEHDFHNDRLRELVTQSGVATDLMRHHMALLSMVALCHKELSTDAPSYGDLCGCVEALTTHDTSFSEGLLADPRSPQYRALCCFMTRKRAAASISQIQAALLLVYHLRELFKQFVAQHLRQLVTCAVLAGAAGEKPQLAAVENTDVEQLKGLLLAFLKPAQSANDAPGGDKP